MIWVDDEEENFAVSPKKERGRRAAGEELWLGSLK